MYIDVSPVHRLSTVDSERQLYTTTSLPASQRRALPLYWSHSGHLTDHCGHSVVTDWSKRQLYTSTSPSPSQRRVDCVELVTRRVRLGGLDQCWGRRTSHDDDLDDYQLSDNDQQLPQQQQQQRLLLHSDTRRTERVQLHATAGVCDYVDELNERQ